MEWEDLGLIGGKKAVRETIEVSWAVRENVVAEDDLDSAISVDVAELKSGI